MPETSVIDLYEEEADGAGGQKKVMKEIGKIVNEAGQIQVSEKHNQFLNLYDKLVIVNPTKEKFKFTTLNYIYYELLRMFSNELEKENSVLFVMGFSFADEHIREIVLRVLNANPTLLVCVFAHDDAAELAIKDNLNIETQPTKYNNLLFVRRPKEIIDNVEVEKKFDLKTINSSFFQDLANDLVKAFRKTRHEQRNAS